MVWDDNPLFTTRMFAAHAAQVGAKAVEVEVNDGRRIQLSSSESIRPPTML
jgi:hypothetical protein